MTFYKISALFDTRYICCNVLFIIGLFVTNSVHSEQITLSFYDKAIVNDTVFTVSDIAQVTGSNCAIVAAVKKHVAGVSAPPGYSRFVAIDELVSYRLKSRFNDVTFMVNGENRITVSTDYKELRLADYETSFREYVGSLIGWKKGNWEVTITNSEDRIKCFNKEFRMLFSGLKDRFPKGTTNCKLTVQQGSYSLSYPVRCRFSVQATVVVTCLPIARGEIITSDKCTIQKRNITAFGPTPYTSIAALKNKRAARSLKPGTILHNRLLLTVPDIEKGDAVSIVLKKGRIAITVSGVARESGEIGDRIWVQNRNTRKLIRVEIRDKGIVEALQGGVSI